MKTDFEMHLRLSISVHYHYLRYCIGDFFNAWQPIDYHILAKMLLLRSMLSKNYTKYYLALNRHPAKYLQAFNPLPITYFFLDKFKRMPQVSSNCQIVTKFKVNNH